MIVIVIVIVIVYHDDAGIVSGSIDGNWYSSWYAI